MLTLLNASFAVWIHASDLPHVHPHETGVALGLGLVLAFIAGSLVAVLRRKPAAP